MEVFIEYFHKVMNGLQIAQVIVVNVYTDAEVETRIASIYNFEIAKLQDEREGEHEVKLGSVSRLIPKGTERYLYKVGVLGVSHSDHCVHFLDQFLFFVVIKVHVPLGQASFACSVLYEYKSNLESKKLDWSPCKHEEPYAYHFRVYVLVITKVITRLFTIFSYERRKKLIMNKLCITSVRAAAIGEQLFAVSSVVQCAPIACTRQLATLRLNSITTFSLFIFV